VTTRGLVLADAGIVTGDEAVAAEFAHLLHEDVELDEFIALDAGVGSSALGVFVDEIVDDRLAELVLEVHDVMGDSQNASDSTGVLDRAEATATGVAGVCLALLPYLHGEANDVVAAALQDGGGYGAVYAAGHGDEDGGLISRQGRFLRS